ncbi:MULTISPECIES: thioredoxin family protein [Ignavibacterium]|jgi:thioredoxin-like negative regulator of GroEL|uniref:thioredoxin family protein n=1 Tax=Ignavibacterium TaxID=795750 RepID=UPI0025C39342|nr:MULTISPECIES: thioredoxin family protein [Ignavibacterium]MBI5661719.1 thioredoxin family protein [Ignavibacterium album]
MNSNSISTSSELRKIIEENPAVCFYLSTPQCNVCKVLKPKVVELLKSDFPQIKFIYVDLNDAKEIAGQLSVFAVPTIIIFFGGKETIRVSRNLSLEQLRGQLERYYRLIFE